MKCYLKVILSVQTFNKSKDKKMEFMMYGYVVIVTTVMKFCGSTSKWKI